MRPNANLFRGFEGHPNWIVVDDPQGNYKDGSLIDATRNKQLTNVGVTTLPVVPDLFRKSGVGGYMKRSWGAGYPLAMDAAHLHCPISLYLDEHCGVMHWAARLVPSEELYPELKTDPPKQLDGFLRMNVDTGQVCNHRVGTASVASPVDMRELNMIDAQDGWTVGGILQITVPMGGHYGFGLYGMAPGLRVAWLAATATLKTER